MQRQPPLPTLFPYTTLFRSIEHGAAFRESRGRRAPLRGEKIERTQLVLAPEHAPRRAGRGIGADGQRSEEHTSELQSHHDLVCRLLLEKKNARRTNCPAASS